MKYNILVTVIIPIYNAEKYLSRCIESILNQSLTSFEVILINDGSTDNSAEICNAYAARDKRLRVLHIDNHGPGYARNLGLKNAKGKYIQFTDSDDTLPVNFLEEMLYRIEDENSDLVVCGIQNVKNNNPINKLTVKEELDYPKKPYIELFVNLLEKGLAYSPCNKLYRNDLIKSNNISFGTEFNIGEDAIFNLSYIKQSKKISFEEIVFYEYHQNDGSLIHSYIQKKFEIQTFLYENLKKLVKEVSNANSIESMYLYYQYEFAFVFINYYLPDCPMNSLDRKKMISKIIQNDVVQEIYEIPNGRSNLQKIIRMLVRIKSVTIMDVFLRTFRRRYL